MDQCHIVFDLDLTCISAFDTKIFKQLNINRTYTEDIINLRSRIGFIDIIDGLKGNKVGQGNLYSCCFITRPYLKELLSFCCKNFKSVTIWSAGRYKYVYTIKEFILPNTPQIAVFTQEDTNIVPVGRGYLTTKDLSKVFAKIEGANETNTLIVDDNQVFGKNPMNGILIPEYSPDGTLESFLENDTNLLKLMKFFQLKEVKECSDVRLLVKSRIFTTSIATYDDAINSETSLGFVNRQKIKK